MKEKLKKILDIIMIILFIILMGYYTTDNIVHEILGITIFVLFIIHNILNIRWYKGIFKGKHNFQRTFHIIINLLLFIAMIGMMISAIMISYDVFNFLNIPANTFGERLHRLSTSWGFVLMSIHAGLHITGFMNKLNKKMKNNTFEYVYYFILVILIAFGIYSFIDARLWEDLFLVNHFKFFDYNQSPIIFYLKYSSIVISISLIIYIIFSVTINKLKNRKEKNTCKKI